MTSTPDLSVIDVHCKTQGPGSLMDRLVTRLSDDDLARLKAACGLTHDGQHARPWTAIAKWLDGLSDEPGKVTADKVSAWAGRQ